MSDENRAAADPPAVTTTVTSGVRRVPLTVSAPAVANGAAAHGSAPVPRRGAPAGGTSAAPAAGIVVIQDAFGATEALAAATRRLAADGYLAVAPHLYHRVAAEPVDDFDTAKPLLRSLTGRDMAHDIADAIEYLDAAGIAADRRGIVGFCMGGTVALWQAASGAFAAAVTFYGGGVSKARWKGVPPGLESGARLACPWLGLYGDKDRSISVSEVEQLRAVVAGTGLATSIVRYPDAGHAFALDPAARSFVAEAAADAWAHALNWFDAHLR